MPTLQIRDMPEDLYDNLKKSAENARRSMTQQAIVLLEMALPDKNIDSEMERRKKVVKEISRGRKLSKKEADLAIQWIREDRDER